MPVSINRKITVLFSAPRLTGPCRHAGPAMILMYDEQSSTSPRPPKRARPCLPGLVMSSAVTASACLCTDLLTGCRRFLERQIQRPLPRSRISPERPSEFSGHPSRPKEASRRAIPEASAFPLLIGNSGRDDAALEGSENSFRRRWGYVKRPLDLEFILTVEIIIKAASEDAAFFFAER